jgi:hypothetical protein
MSQLQSLNESKIRSEDVTPDDLAWKLLMDTDVDEDADVQKYTGIMQNFVINESDLSNNKNTRYDQIADNFQILITMYMEMVIGYMNIAHMASHMNENYELDGTIDLEETFKPDYSKFTIDDMLVLFREKFKKIRFFLSVQEITGTEISDTTDYGKASEYYCKIILKDTHQGKLYFAKNIDNPAVDHSKRYTFLMRYDKNKSQKKLEDFYAVCCLPNIKVKIYFSPLNIIIKE